MIGKPIEWRAPGDGRCSPSSDEVDAMIAGRKPGQTMSDEERAYVAGQHPKFRHPSEKQPQADFSPKFAALPPRENWGDVDPQQLYDVAATRIPKAQDAWKADKTLVSESLAAMAFAEANGARGQVASRPGERRVSFNPGAFGTAPARSDALPPDEALAAAVAATNFISKEKPPAPAPDLSSAAWAQRAEIERVARKLGEGHTATPFGSVVPKAAVVTDTDPNSPTAGQKVSVAK